MKVMCVRIEGNLVGIDRGNCGDEGSGGVHGDEDDRLFTWVQLLENDILIPILFTVLTLHPIPTPFHSQFAPYSP